MRIESINKGWCEASVTLGRVGMVEGGRIMPKLSNAPYDADTVLAGQHCENINSALEQALNKLADLDTRHQRELVSLCGLCGSKKASQRVRTSLVARYRERRERHVARLAEVHQRLTYGTLFRQVH